MSRHLHIVIAGNSDSYTQWVKEHPNTESIFLCRESALFELGFWAECPRGSTPPRNLLRELSITVCHTEDYAENPLWGTPFLYSFLQTCESFHAQQNKLKICQTCEYYVNQPTGPICNAFHTLPVNGDCADYSLKDAEQQAERDRRTRARMTSQSSLQGLFQPAWVEVMAERRRILDSENAVRLTGNEIAERRARDRILAQRPERLQDFLTSEELIRLRRRLPDPNEYRHGDRFRLIRSRDCESADFECREFSCGNKWVLLGQVVM